METEIKTLLKEYGLDDSEIKICLFLAGNKGLTAYKIAKETKIHRSTCYDILERLITKGFVSKIERQCKNYYEFNELSKIIANIKDKETILMNLIPRLQELESKQEVKVRMLEGIEGQKQFDYNIFKLSKENKINYCYILGNFYASSLSSDLLIERLINEFKKLKLDKKVDYKGIWNPKYKKDKIIKQYSLVGKNKFLDVPSKVTTVIFGEYVAYLFTLDKPYIIEIKSKVVAEEMKFYFNELWNIAKN